MSETTPARTTRVTIGNRYSVDIDAPIGAGGMATVYRGVDLQSRRPVALKTLRTEYQRDPASRQRFRREARAMAFVNHPNLVTIYDLHEEQDGSWVVMELVEGRTLKELVRREGPLPVERVALILQQLANALGHLHERNLVHLDIKPQNIMLTPAGEVKLIDFGLAQRPGVHTEMLGGMAFGTVAYLAPEQAKGDPVGPETDVYSLACVVYELLTGVLPFQVPDGPDQKRDLIEAHLEALPPAPSSVRPELDLPAWVDDVIGWGLVKDPQARVRDVRQFARLFRSGLEGASLPDTQPTQALGRDAASGSGDTGRVRRVTFRRRTQVPVAMAREAAPPQALPELREDMAGVMGRAYRTGGRLARRSRRLQRKLWRVLAVMLIATALLGLVVWVQQGPEALVADILSVAPGTDTVVIVDQLNVRAAPTTQAPLLGVLEEGSDVQVTGLSETEGEFRFWPVEAEVDGEAVSGWVWEGGLQANAWTGRMSWMQGVVDGVQGVREGVEGRWDTVTGWLPG